MPKYKFLNEELSAYSSKAQIPAEMIGTVSDDRSAIVGKSGWCYIYQGSNDYRNSYLDDSLVMLGVEWAKLFEARQLTCERMGIKFLQVIIPNKLTLLPEYYPEALKTDISFMLKGIINAGVNANLLLPLTEFRADNVREAIFRRNDSHLTIAGNAYLAELILDGIGLNDFTCEAAYTHMISHTGDLGNKFTNSISEEVHVPLWSKGLLNQAGVEKVKDIKPAGLCGIEQQFVNPHAPIRKKIMVIGNSFFERVPGWGLSPFFSSLFSDYYFIWSPSFDAKLIEEYMPDFVVSQTCERFLTKLPNEQHSVLTDLARDN